MCRLLGIVTLVPTRYRVLLKEAPRSLATLSQEHPDGWGLAVYSSQDRPENGLRFGWNLNRGISCANDDGLFHDLATQREGEVLISHVRKKTVGEISIPNTHPFLKGKWIFAHNGTIDDLNFLRERISATRLSEIEGETDSELLFAFILSQLDAQGLTEQPPNEKTDELLKSIFAELFERPGLGFFNVFLSNGETLYVCRFGEKQLFILERGPHEGVHHKYISHEDGTVIETPWKKRGYALFIASEKMTSEDWQEIPDRTVMRIDRLPKPHYRVI